MSAKTLDSNDRIVSDPDICNGKPTIRGTRITVQTVLEFLGAGDSIEEVLTGYPRLTQEDVLACIQYAARLAGNRVEVRSLAQ